MWWGELLPASIPWVFSTPCSCWAIDPVRARLLSIPSSSVGYGCVLLPSWASVSPFVDIKLFVGAAHTQLWLPRAVFGNAATGITAHPAGRGWKEPTASPGCCRYSRSTSPAGEGTPAFGTVGSGKESSQLGKREVLKPGAAQPAAPSANPAANLTLRRTGSGPHSIPASSWALSHRWYPKAPSRRWGTPPAHSRPSS